MSQAMPATYTNQGMTNKHVVNDSLADDNHFLKSTSNAPSGRSPSSCQQKQNVEVYLTL